MKQDGEEREREAREELVAERRRLGSATVRTAAHPFRQGMIRRFVGGAGLACPPCVIVTVRPATRRTPVRDAVVAGTLKLTAPIPAPADPAVIVIQVSLVVAVHEQVVPLVTESVKMFPFGGTVNDVGVTV